MVVRKLAEMEMGIGTFDTMRGLSFRTPDIE